LPEPAPKELKARKAPSKIRIKRLLKREKYHEVTTSSMKPKAFAEVASLYYSISISL
jgi:hypothetical protein